MNILIPMAGEGSRFKICGYEKPKPLIDVGGVPMIRCSVDTLGLEGKYIFVIREYDDPRHTQELVKCLKSIKPDCEIVKTKKLTRGAAETCLLAKHLINNDEKLVITNCDQLMSWDSENFQEQTALDFDGIVVTHTSSDPKNSFISVNKDGFALELREKKPISDLALIGLHYWKHGKYFVESAEKMIGEGDKDANEFYVAPTYNYMIQRGLKVTNYHLEKNEYHPLGTPDDLNIYIGKKNEFKTEKPKTIVCDLDGTILRHVHRYSDIKDAEQKLNPGVIDKFNEWDSFGHHIILMTARKESARTKTERDLFNLGIPYDQLVMGVTSGKRIIINDRLTNSCEERACSVNVLTDKGFYSTDWKKLGL